MNQALIDFFKRKGNCDPKQLAESATDIVNFYRIQKASKNIADKSLQKALTKVKSAIDVITESHKQGHSSDQTHYFLKSLSTAFIEAGEPGDKEPVTVTSIQLNGDNITSEIKQNRENTRLIFELEAFWYKHFSERPSLADGHPFNEFAAICIGSEAGAIRKKRERSITPTSEPGE